MPVLIANVAVNSKATKGWANARPPIAYASSSIRWVPSAMSMNVKHVAVFIHVVTPVAGWRMNPQPLASATSVQKRSMIITPAI